MGVLGTVPSRDTHRLRGSASAVGGGWRRRRALAERGRRGKLLGDAVEVARGRQRADRDPQVVAVGAHEERRAGGDADALGGEGDDGGTLVVDAPSTG